MKDNSRFSCRSFSDVFRVVLIVLVAGIILCACRSGEVDSQCLWGPIPSDKKLADLKARGVKTIINCRLNRLPGKEKVAKELGLNYVHIPTGLFEPPTEEHIRQFLTVVRDPDKRPVYICDQVARDRTQFYAAVYGMDAYKWPAEKASKQMYRNGLRHWWPWFYKYKHVVKKYEKDIHGDASARTSAKEVLSGGGNI